MKILKLVNFAKKFLLQTLKWKLNTFATFAKTFIVIIIIIEIEFMKLNKMNLKKSLKVGIDYIFNIFLFPLNIYLKFLFF